MLPFRVLFLFFLTVCIVSGHPLREDTIDYEYDFRKAVRLPSNTNKSTTTDSFCPIGDLPPRKRRFLLSYKKYLQPLWTPSITTSFRQAFETRLTKISQQTQLIWNATRHQMHHLEYTLYMIQTRDYVYQVTVNLLRYHIQPIVDDVRRSLWPVIYNISDKKDDVFQLLSDIYTHPRLEWHIFSGKLTHQFNTVCRLVGIDVFVRHLREQLLTRLPESLVGHTTSTAPPFSHLDDLFRDMVETDYHSKFYRQQMTRYYQWMPAHEKTQALYSKRDFTQWATEGAAKTHDFVTGMQTDWLQLMQSLYHDIEVMLDCLSLPPPISLTRTATTGTRTTKCSPKLRRQPLLLLSPPSSTIISLHSRHEEENQERHSSKHDDDQVSSASQQHYEWMFELEQLYRELENTINCICPHSLPGEQRYQSSDHLTEYEQSQQKQHQTYYQYRQKQQQEKLHQQQNGSPSEANSRQTSIEMLASLKKTMKKRLARLDKELHRQFFASTPPRSHQPMHYIYERLRENVSAMNKSTCEKYLTQLILSWTSMIANTLDMTATVAEDLVWLQSKQYTADNGKQFESIDHAESIELIWTSAQRKMEKNNVQLISQWELIFTDMDHELQSAWKEMLDIVDESHRSSLERVKSFWSHNKSRLSHFFTSLFQSPSSINIVDQS